MRPSLASLQFLLTSCLLHHRRLPLHCLKLLSLLQHLHHLGHLVDAGSLTESTAHRHAGRPARSTCYLPTASPSAAALCVQIRAHPDNDQHRCSGHERSDSESLDQASFSQLSHRFPLK